MPKALDVAGQRFGRLTAIECLGTIKGKRYWAVQCDCGNEELVNVANLKNGHTKSCGCLQKEAVSRPGKNLKHGGKRGGNASTEYKAWANLKQSIYVEMVPEWDDFQQFFKDVGWRPSPEHELKRRDVREQHGPMNTYWRSKDEDERLRNLTNRDLGDDFFIDMRAISRANQAAKERERAEAGVLR